MAFGFTFVKKKKKKKAERNYGQWDNFLVFII